MTALFNHWNEKQWIVDLTREKIIHEGILFHSMLLSCLPKYTFIVVLITSSLFTLVNCFYVYAMNHISHWTVSKDKDITEQLEPEECILASLLYCPTCSQWYASVPFLLPNEDAVQINADVLCLHHCTTVCTHFYMQYVVITVHREWQLLTYEASRGVRLHVTLAENITEAHFAVSTVHLCNTDCWVCLKHS